MNMQRALKVLRSLGEAGVREVVLCAGARNAPLVAALSRARGVHTYSFFEERSAGFFALGRILSTGRPVAVITTSGTAAANLLPAVIESDYQAQPLVVVTADRPSRYRGSGSPQAIIQPGLYSHYVERSWDIEGDGAKMVIGRRPVHVNVCFDEPLLDQELSAWDWPVCEEWQPPALPVDVVEISARRPLVILGGLPWSERARVREIVQRWQRPVYAEAISQLREDFPALDLRATEYDSVIRIGSVPTLRLWRDLENSSIPVWHFSDTPFSGLPRSRTVHSLSSLRHYEFEKWTPSAVKTPPFERFPLSEPSWVRWLSQQIPSEARLFLGNSLPIREWDLAAARTPEVFANRGANGIDGLLSTFLGVCELGRSNWCLLGDLSALYDLSGPWALSQRPVGDVNFVILNNGGGKIFQRLFNNPLFENRHQLGFAAWAQLWHLEYLRLTEPRELSGSRRPRVIEIVPDERQTENFWALP